MKLICEQLEDVEFICESDKQGKNYFIEGVFMQANVKNRNADYILKLYYKKKPKDMIKITSNKTELLVN
tara:strand:+ start:345 stop:551 length:207 start_codon:yes stop_codon:yes gene_type:complete